MIPEKGASVFEFTPGGTVLDKRLFMKNVGSINGSHMDFAVANTPSGISGTSDDPYYNDHLDDRMRITKLEYGLYGETLKSLLKGGAGADLSNYVAPTHCDVKVNLGGTYHTISEAVDNAADGQVICVGHGNYNDNWEGTGKSHGGTGFPIVVDKSITLVSMEGPDKTTITAPGTNAINITANNVTIKGFTIKGADYGIDIEGATGVTVEDNIVKNYKVEGIWMNGGSATIANNVIKANDNGTAEGFPVDSIYTKGKVTVAVTHNDLGNNQYTGNVQTGAPNPGAWSTAAGIAVHQGCNVTATYNKIYDNDFGIQVKGLQAIGSTTSPTVIANYNDIYGNSLSDFFYEKIAEDTTIPFDATNNWWGADTFTLGANVKAGDANGFIDVDDYIDYSSYAGGPFIGYINGVDSNTNGYADLDDFRRQGIKNVTPGLNVNQWGELDMAVQLDGPTTNNNYQGGTVGMDMTVTMQQSPAN